MHSTKPALGIVAGLALLVILVAWLAQPRGSAPVTPVDPAGGAAPETVSFRESVLRQGHARALQDQPAAPAADEPLPAPRSPREEMGRRWVTNAIRTLQQIERLKADLPVEADDARLWLSGMERKLFEDDWRRAALHDGALDATQAEAAFAAASADVEAGTPNATPLLRNYRAAVDDPARSEVDVAATLKDHYQARLESTVSPGFRQVSAALEPVAATSEILETGLLSDAWTYVAARTEWADQMAKSRSSQAMVARRMVEGGSPPTPETAAGLGHFFQRADEDLQARFDQVRGAYETLFDWRLREIHGIQNPGVILDALSKLDLRGASPLDLRIPAR